MQFLNDILHVLQPAQESEPDLAVAVRCIPATLDIYLQNPGHAGHLDQDRIFLVGCVFGWVVLQSVGCEQSGGVPEKVGDLHRRFGVAGCDPLFDPVIFAGNLHFALHFVLVGSQPVLLRFALFLKTDLRVQVPPTVLHPSRYLMQAAPFLIPGSPIWLHRLWQVLLWIVMPLLTGYVLMRRLDISDRLQRWMVVAAVFLYLGIGPVYYHLLVPVVLILWGFHSLPAHSNKLRFAISLLVVLLASAWAGISRINWFPVPGSLAVTLILLEEPLLKSASNRPGSQKPAEVSDRNLADDRVVYPTPGSLVPGRHGYSFCSASAVHPLVGQPG